jgi:16S rRNA G1207 methylase RsmC
MTRTKAVRCDTRQLAAAEVMRDCLAALAPKGDLLLAGDGAELVADAVRHAGARPVLWSRWYVPGLPAQPWRPDGSYSGACLRLPRSRGELDMMLQAVASVVVPDGFVCVYGGNDEGIRSTASRLAPVLDEVETIAARRHCRVLHGVRRAETPDLKGGSTTARPSCSRPCPS